MSIIRPRVSRAQAEALVSEYTGLASRLYKERLFEHPFTVGLQNGKIPDHQLRGWLQNWYTFALEVNTRTGRPHPHGAARGAGGRAYAGRDDQCAASPRSKGLGRLPCATPYGGDIG
jgi:hypothetical protein